jgi:hypothetical protein
MEHLALNGRGRAVRLNGPQTGRLAEGVAEEEQRYAQVLRDIRDLRGEPNRRSVGSWAGAFSVFATAAREFVEDLSSVEELETGDGRVDPQAIYRRREARLLIDMLEHGTAALIYTGVGVNLLALRHEICTVLVIDDPGWYERECGELRICDEYLQQCQQTDLLPDQRWVQLISLDRNGLEMEPRWRDALSARNIVAPGAAAIDLGLRVARAVTS